MMNLSTFRFAGYFGVLIAVIAILKGQNVQGLGDSQLGADLYFRGGHVLNVNNPILRTRAISQATKATAVVEKLLAEAKRVRSRSKNYVSFRKDGDYATALADFNAANPVLHKVNRSYINMRGSNRGSNKNYPLAGAVGDTRLILRQNGDRKSKGLPVLEIRHALDPLYIRIVYKKTEK